MINLSVLNNAPALITVLGIMATAMLLTMAVMKNLQNPAKHASFQQAMDIIQSSELDIDTALNKDEKESRGWFEYWADLTKKTGKIVRDDATPGRTALGLAIAGAGLGVLVFPGGPVGVVLAPVALFAFRMWLNAEARKRIAAMEKQLPILLSGMRANLQAGATAQKAILSVADDIPAPLGDELRILKRDMSVNVPLEMALHDLAARVPSREMQFLVGSIEIAIRSGADLDPQLVTIQEIVQQRTRIRQKLAAAVAQVKPTQFLALGAVPLMFLVSMRTPANRTYWFSSGLLMLIIAGILYGLGFFAIRTMIKSVEQT